MSSNDQEQQPVHWCKAVLQEVQQSSSSVNMTSSIPYVPPPQPPRAPSSILNMLSASGGPTVTNAATLPRLATTTTLPSAYATYYQQYYNMQQSAPQPQPQSQAQVQPVLTTGVGQSYAQQQQYIQSLYGQQTQLYSAQPSISTASHAQPSYIAPAVYSMPSGTQQQQQQYTPAPTVYQAAPTQQAWRGATATIAAVSGQTATAHTSGSTTPAANYSNNKPNPARFTAAQATKTDAATSFGKSTWPLSLKQYVTRNFSLCHNEVDRTFAEQELRSLILKVESDGRIAIHKWDLEPNLVLPSVKKQVAAEPVSVVDSRASRVDTSSFSSVQSVSSSSAAAGGKKRKSRFEAPPGKEDTMIRSIYGPGDTAEMESPALKKKSWEKSADVVVDRRELESRDKRSSRFQKAEDERRETADMEAKRRKKQQHISASQAASASINGPDFDLESLQVVGTCERIEKDYFRLTSAPDPSTVRPEPILLQALAMLHNKWEEKSVEYTYMCSQLKAIRQDLTVQHIQNNFTVQVYEMHARVALESRDLNEYNQCQTQLKQLYARKQFEGHEMEFTAYRILYYVYLKGNNLKGGSSDMVHCLANLPLGADKNEFVTHALHVRKAIQEENYHTFFKLYKDVPNLGKCLLSLNINSWRFQYLQRILKAYKPQVETSFVLTELVLPCNQEGIEFLRKAGIVFEVVDGNIDTTAEDFQNSMIDTKDSVIDAAELLSDATNLF